MFTGESQAESIRLLPIQAFVTPDQPPDLGASARIIVLKKQPFNFRAGQLLILDPAKRDPKQPDRRFHIAQGGKSFDSQGQKALSIGLPFRRRGARQ